MKMKAIINRLKVLFAGLMVVVLWGCGSTAATEPSTAATATAEIEPDYYEPRWEEGVLLSSAYASAQVGDILEFGTYEQDNNLSNGSEPILWEVVEVKDGSIKVVSCYILDLLKERNSENNYSWRESHLRSWLNYDFLDTAFTPEEEECIETTPVDSRDLEYEPSNDLGWIYHGSFDTEGIVWDKIFVPAVNVGESYPADLGRTKFAREKDGINYNFVRNTLVIAGSAPCVVDAGEPISTNSSVTYAREFWRYGVRPVMWLKTK